MSDAIDNRLGPNFGRPLSHRPLSEQIARLTDENARLAGQVAALREAGNTLAEYVDPQRLSFAKLTAIVAWRVALAASGGAEQA